MKIEFMIYPQKEVESTNFSSNIVMEMMKKIFPQITHNVITYEQDEIKYQLFYKMYEDKQPNVYFEITYDNENGEQAAKLLSDVRDRICQGEHRKDFTIICTYDEASLTFCCFLMKPFGIFERKIRELIYMRIYRLIGRNWIDTTFPKELQNEIIKKMATDNKKTEPKRTEFFLEYLDYYDIEQYLFETNLGLLEYTKTTKEELLEENLERYSKDELIKILSKFRNETLWDKLFGNNKNYETLKEDIKKLRKGRNATMHQHTITTNQYMDIQNILQKVILQLDNAIDDVRVKIYTYEEIKNTIYALTTLATVASKAIREANERMGIVSKNIKNNLDYFAQLSTAFSGMGSGLENSIANSAEALKLLGAAIPNIYKNEQE